jgi:hypothetical protein
MKTKADAERVLKLCKDRESISCNAKSLMRYLTIDCCDFGSLKIVHHKVEFISLINREADAQISAIDEELERLGVRPD